MIRYINIDTRPVSCSTKSMYPPAQIIVEKKKIRVRAQVRKKTYQYKKYINTSLNDINARFQ